MDWIEFQRVRGSIRVKPNGRCERFLEQVERRRPVYLDLPSISVAPRSFSSTTTPQPTFPRCVRASVFHLTFPSDSSAPWSTVWACLVAFTRLPVLWSTGVDRFLETRNFPRDCRRPFHPRIPRAVSGSLLLHENLIECYPFFLHNAWVLRSPIK